MDANKKLAEEVYSKIEAYPYTRVQIIEYLAAVLERRYREGVEAIWRNMLLLLGKGEPHEMFTRVDVETMLAKSARLLAEGKEGNHV